MDTFGLATDTSVSLAAAFVAEAGKRGIKGRYPQSGGRDFTIYTSGDDGPYGIMGDDYHAPITPGDTVYVWRSSPGEYMTVLELPRDWDKAMRLLDEAVKPPRVKLTDLKSGTVFKAWDGTIGVRIKDDVLWMHGGNSGKWMGRTLGGSISSGATAKEIIGTLDASRIAEICTPLEGAH